MNLWLVALCSRCNIALRARAHTSHALMHHACWSHFTLWVGVITTTKWVTTWCSEEVNWFINIWVEEPISTSRAVHKGCGSILFIFRRMDFCRLLPGIKCRGCCFRFLCWVSCATPELERQPACCCLGTMSPINPGAEALLTSRSRAPFHSCGVGQWTWHVLGKG